MKTSNCRSCRAPIVWVATLRDKKMPVDADPSEDGAFVLVDHPQGGDTPLAVHVSAADSYVDAEQLTEANRHASHFSTCPHAGTHRRGFAVPEIVWALVWSLLCAALGAVAAINTKAEVDAATGRFRVAAQVEACAVEVARSRAALDSVHVWLHGRTEPVPLRIFPVEVAPDG